MFPPSDSETIFKVPMVVVGGEKKVCLEVRQTQIKDKKKQAGHVS